MVVAIIIFFVMALAFFALSEVIIFQLQKTQKFVEEQGEYIKALENASSPIRAKSEALVVAFNTCAESSGRGVDARIEINGEVKKEETVSVALTKLQRVSEGAEQAQSAINKAYEKYDIAQKEYYKK